MRTLGLGFNLGLRSTLAHFPRATIRSYIQPTYFVDPAALPEDFSLWKWSRRFTWEQDAWRGWRDTISPVAETVRTERGDCDDYATVAASWALREERDDVRFGYCWGRPNTSHLVAVDADRVYSSGWISRPGTTFSDYIRDSRYDWGTTWRIQK